MEKVGFSDKDVQNVVHNIRRDTIDENDAQAALQCLKKLSAENPLFFTRSNKMMIIPSLAFCR